MKASGKTSRGFEDSVAEVALHASSLSFHSSGMQEMAGQRVSCWWNSNLIGSGQIVTWMMFGVSCSGTVMLWTVYAVSPLGLVAASWLDLRWLCGHEL